MAEQVRDELEIAGKDHLDALLTLDLIEMDTKAPGRLFCRCYPLYIEHEVEVVLVVHSCTLTGEDEVLRGLVNLENSPYNCDD